MKRLLKIAEFRDPTPNDVSTSTSLANITKEHLEYFFNIFRNLVERPVEDVTVNAEFDIMSRAQSDDENINIEDVLPSPSDSESSSDCENTERALPSPSPSDVSSEILDEISSETEEEQFEVERIISRTVNAEGKYVYHIKWVGYETSSDPENFVDEEDMHCPELIKEFEQMESLKKKQRAKRLEEQAMRARKRKQEAEQRAKAAHCPELIKEFEQMESLKKKQRAKRLEEQAMRARKRKQEAEQRAKAAFASTSRRNSTEEAHRKKSCKEINLCSSSDSSEEEEIQPNVRRRTDKKSAAPSRSPDQHSKKKSKHKASPKLKKRIESTSTSSEEEEVVTPITGCEIIDTNKVHMANTDRFELRQYFVAASGCTDPKKLALHLLLQLPKAP
ncbi:chromo' (CHRromatin Organization MOdifier) domain protein [Ostertagia ostertagi]